MVVRAVALSGVVVLGVVASQPLTASGSRDVRLGAVDRAATPLTRILYASDWTGPTELFAVDPSTRATLGQLTSGKESSCGDSFGLPVVPCGFTNPIPSPDGRWLLFGGTNAYPGGVGQGSLWLAAANGSDRHEFPMPSDSEDPWSAAWSPDSTAFAYFVPCVCDQGGLHIVRVRQGAVSDRLAFPERSTGFGAVVWSRKG